MNKKYDVLGIGNAIVDVLAKIDDEFLAKHNLAKAGMTLIDEEQSENIYSDMPAAREISGGSAANTLAGLASFGANCAFIGKVKNDQLGKIFAHDLKATGVDYSTVKAQEGPRTANSLVLITPDAQRTMATYLGATRFLAPFDIDDNLVEDSSIIYLEGYLWDEAEAKDAIRKAINIAKESGNKIAFSLSDLFCVERHRDEFWQLIKNDIDILFCNEQELAGLTEKDDFAESVEIIRQECDLVAVTRGEQGSLVLSGGDSFEIEAEKNLQVEDTTGAGDLYASGFLYGFVKGFSLDKCGLLGTLAASEIICHVGARPEIKLSDLLKEAA